uniref:Uncharacterized protein n=1 Tax=Rhizophora mucronata TaxID=61149 RepID=A0A2P2JRY7_RHIMU
MNTATFDLRLPRIAFLDFFSIELCFVVQLDQGHKRTFELRLTVVMDDSFLGSRVPASDLVLVCFVSL